MACISIGFNSVFPEYMCHQCQNNYGAHMYVDYTGSTRHV